MNVQKSNKRIIVAMFCYIFCPVAILVLFQNCGNQKTMSAATVASLDTGDLITPEPEPVVSEDDYSRRVEANQMVANRILTANYFKAIFGPDIETTAAAYIAHQPDDFGSGTTIYDRVITTDCNTKKNIYKYCSRSEPMRPAAPSNIGTNIRREAFRIRTCNVAVKYRTLDALKIMDSTTTGAKIPEINDVNLKKAFALFYRGRKAPGREVLESLTIAAGQKDKPYDQWKEVFLAICLSPHWQVL